MGKKKNKKFGAPKPQPTGFISIPIDEDEFLNDSSPTVVATVLQQLQSAEESTRECGCGTLAALAAEPGALPVLLSNNVVRILAPLVIDVSPCVRHRALGALRNMTVDGGLDVCHEMVLKDVLTPLTALLKQYAANWEPEKTPTKHTDTRLDIFVQAVHVLWNLCEASDIAVTVFNKENLLPILLPCLQHFIYGYPLATAVAQCLQTVTERNAEAAEVCRGSNVLPMLNDLTNKTDSSSQAMLFQAALMGILMNVLGGELTNGAGLSAFVLTLGRTLDINGATLIANYAVKKSQTNGVAAASAMDARGDASGDAAQQNHMLVEEDVSPSDCDFQDIVNTLDAQRLCLELTTNMCCSPDEDWEEIDSSESGSSDEMTVGADMDQDVGTENNNFEPVCTPVEVHSAFEANNIMAKVLQLSLPLPVELEASLKSHKWGKRIIKKLERLRTHALLCINNSMETLPLGVVGGTEVLHQLWDSLAEQVKAAGSAEGASSSFSSTHEASDWNLLEASISAMRAVIQKLANLNSPRFAQVTVADIHFLLKMAGGAVSCVQIHIMRIVATIAVVLVKTDPLCAVVQEVGTCLLMAATHGTDLVVVAEALDALFDVFADDATHPVTQTLQVTEKLRSIAPQLKVKVQSQRKALGENYITVATALKNLVRFIKYKESVKH